MMTYMQVYSAFHFVTYFFFFNDTATTEIYTLSLHDALPIYGNVLGRHHRHGRAPRRRRRPGDHAARSGRSEEHTSELQSRRDLVCRLLLEKKNTKIQPSTQTTT